MRALVEVEDEIVAVGIEQGGVIAFVQPGDGAAELEQQQARKQGAGGERTPGAGEEVAELHLGPF